VLCKRARLLKNREALNPEMDHSSILDSVRGGGFAQQLITGETHLLLNFQVDICRILFLL
jgi:hypothetical protein